MEADQDAQKAQELAEAEEEIRQANEEQRHKGKLGFRSGFKKMLGRD